MKTFIGYGIIENEINEFTKTFLRKYPEISYELGNNGKFYIGAISHLENVSGIIAINYKSIQDVKKIFEKEGINASIFFCDLDVKTKPLVFQAADCVIETSKSAIETSKNVLGFIHKNIKKISEKIVNKMENETKDESK